MQTYTTQMDAARKGIITPEMEIVAKKEYRTTEEIRQWVAEGKVAIPANKHHTCLNPEGVGSMLRTKINVNLGVSRDCKDYNIEMQKVMSAVNMGAEAIMDLSSHGNTQPFRQKLTHECPVMIGTVPVYDSVIHYQRDLAELTAQDFIDVVRLHAEDGVDFVTLHCGITRKTIEQIRKHKRKMNIVSRGGSLVFAWMSMTGNENPFYEHFDEICEICAEHDVTISLGDACRPGCLADATDVCQIEELVRLGELTKRAWAHNVQVMVEGPGHVPLNQVAANMEVQKSICMGAPFYVLGPLVTDIAPGYDHITAAIGGAVAAASGAAFLCYVTPAEHLALPNVDDVKQGIVASKIAAHAADIAKGIPHARDIDDKMGDARRVLDWDAQFACALDPETAKAIRDARLPEDDHSDTCSMCGSGGRAGAAGGAVRRPGGRGGGVFPGAAGERRCGLGPFPGSRGVCSPGGVPPRGKAGRRLFATERYAAERPCAWGWPSSCGPRPASTAWPSGCAAKPSRRCGATCCGRCCLRWGRWGSSGGSRHPKTG